MRISPPFLFLNKTKRSKIRNIGPGDLVPLLHHYCMESVKSSSHRNADIVAT